MKHARFFLSNCWTRIYLDALSEVMGHHGYTALLRIAGLHAWIYNPPPYDDVLDVDVEDFVLLNKSLEDIYGPRGGRSLAFRTGQIAFRIAWERLDIDLGLRETAFNLLPEEKRMHVILEALAKEIAQANKVEITLTEDETTLQIEVTPCPVYTGHKAVRSVCQGIAGFTRATLMHANTSDDYTISETACGVPEYRESLTCVFVIQPM